MPTPRTTAFLTLLTVLAAASLASGTTLDASIQGFRADHPVSRLVLSKDGARCDSASGFRSAPLGEDAEAGAQLFLAEHARLFGLVHAASDLIHDRTVPHRGRQNVRFQQTLGGLPVFGAHVIAVVDAAGRVVRVSSDAVSPAIDDPEPLLTVDEGVLAATGDLQDPRVLPRVTLGYLPVQGRAFLVYEVAAQTAGPHLWISYVSAADGHLVWRHDAIRRHQAMVYEENPITTSELVEVTVESVADGEHANHTYGPYARVASCVDYNASTADCDVWEFYAEATAGDGFTDIEPFIESNPDDDPFSEVQAFYSLDHANRWFRDEMGFIGQFTDYEAFFESGETDMVPADHIWLFVNANYQNGHFSGGGWWGGADSIMLGSIYNQDLGYDNDVTVHEFTHAVSSKAFSVGYGNLDELGIDSSSGGVEEGTADYFAFSMHGNPKLGEWVGVGRDADNNNLCPLDIIGESHHDGEIVGGAMWDIWQELGKKKTDHLHWAALTGGTVDTFTDFGNELLAAAEAMHADDSDPDLQLTAEELAFVENEVEERNLIDCERVVPLHPGDQVLHYMPYAFFDQGMPSPVQYSIQSDDDDAVIEFVMSVMGQKKMDVLGRAGQPVHYEWTGSMPNFEFETTHDFEWRHSELGDDFEVKVSNLTDPPLEPGQIYYFSILCLNGGQGCQNMLSAAHSPIPEEPPGGDADADADADGGDADAGADGGAGGGDGGCGCSVSGSRRGLGRVGALIELLIGAI